MFVYDTETPATGTPPPPPPVEPPPTVYPKQELDDLADRRYEIEKRIQNATDDTRDALIEEYRAVDRQFKDLQRDWWDDTITMRTGQSASDPYTGGLSDTAYKARDVYVVKDEATLAMNAALRSGKKATAKVRRIDAMVEEGTVQQDVLLFRSAILPRNTALDVGAEFTDLAFQSTATVKDMALRYMRSRAVDIDGEAVLFNMVVPPGVHAVNVGVGEVVLQRGLTLRVTGSRIVDGVRVVDVTVRRATAAAGFVDDGGEPGGDEPDSVPGARQFIDPGIWLQLADTLTQ